jgi:hypothetical protein
MTASRTKYWREYNRKNAAKKREQQLTAERDQLRAENATFRAAQKACEACDEPTAFEVRQIRAELATERARSPGPPPRAPKSDQNASKLNQTRPNPLAPPHTP